jgi:O-antigen/teichoic acid export membrane protein
MIGVLVAMLAGVAIGAFKTCRLWTGQATKFVWTPWLKRIVPLTLGIGATTFMFTVDMLAVQRFLTQGSGHYGAAGMIARAIMFLVAPMVMVMFPKIVRSEARSEKSDVLGQTLGLTALIAIGAAVFATFFAKIPILIVQGPGYLPAVPLVPWFTWCILPLTVSSVLVNNLMARQDYKVVPWLVLVALGYVFTLWLPIGHASQLHVIKTLGLFATLYFLVCLWFTWGTNLFFSKPRA